VGQAVDAGPPEPGPAGSAIEGHAERYAGGGSSSNLSEGAFTDVLHWWSLSDFDLVRSFDKTTRFKIKEGMGALAQQMLMDSTAEVALSTPVRSIDKSGSTYQVTTAGDKGFRARAVVMAVPQNVLSSIAITPELSAGKRLMAANGQAGHGTKCYIHVRQKIGKWIGMAPAPNPISVVFTDREMADGSLLACFGPPGKLDITDEAAVQSALRQLLPKVEVVGVTGYQWAADPYSRGTWCWYRPGQLTAGWEDMRRAEGGLFMAGSDVAEGWRGFVDGAIESGYTAARDVRAFLKGDAMRLIYVLPLLLALQSAQAADCNLQRGKVLFESKCAMCHSAQQGEAHSVGPNLFGVVGRLKGGRRPSTIPRRCRKPAAPGRQSSLSCSCACRSKPCQVLPCRSRA
jgi:mono/diheme cytochrome c family protein